MSFVTFYYEVMLYGSICCVRGSSENLAVDLAVQVSFTNGGKESQDVSVV